MLEASAGVPRRIDQRRRLTCLCGDWILNCLNICVCSCGGHRLYPASHPAQHGLASSPTRPRLLRSAVHAAAVRGLAVQLYPSTALMQRASAVRRPDYTPPGSPNAALGRAG